jgi:hypothetical protein
MSESVLSVDDAAARLPELVEQAHTANGAAVIIRSGSRMVRIVPISGEPEASPDLVAYLRQWALDHPEPDEGFAEAVEFSRKTLQSPRDPWE